MTDILYEKDRVKVTYLYSPEIGKENEIISREDHELWLKGKDSEWSRYIIQRGILRDLSRRLDDKSELVDMLDRINHYIVSYMQDEGISLTDVSQAISGAYQKEEEEFEKFLAEQRDN